MIVTSLLQQHSRILMVLQIPEAPGNDKMCIAVQAHKHRSSISNYNGTKLNEFI